MVSPRNNNQENMDVSPVPTNLDNLRSYRENNRIGNGIYNRNHDDIMIQNPNPTNFPVDLNLFIYTTNQTGDIDRIWRFEENVVLPTRGNALPIHLR